MSHLFVTLRMVIVATVIAIFVAIFMGVLAAVRQGKVTDHAITVTNFVLLATPIFVLGLALKEFVAIPINQHLNTTIFYTDGEQSPTLSGSFFSRLPDYAEHTALPAITLILISYASWAIYQRSSMIETLDADHVRLARAKGLSQRRVLFRHVLRNALIPVTTVDRAGLRRGPRWRHHHRDRLRLAGTGAVVPQRRHHPGYRTSCWPTCSSRPRS